MGQMGEHGMVLEVKLWGGERRVLPHLLCLGCGWKDEVLSLEKFVSQRVGPQSCTLWEFAVPGAVQ